MPIFVKVSDLFKLVKDLRHSNMDFVEVDYYERQDLDDDEYIPACLGFEAFSRKKPFEHIQFDNINEADISEFFDDDDEPKSYSTNSK
jgi:hypothetical protein